MRINILKYLVQPKNVDAYSWSLNLIQRCFIGNMDEFLCLLEGIDLQKPAIVLTPNLNHLRVSSHSQKHMETYLNGDYVLADGMPICWLSQKFLHRDINRLSGVDLVYKLIEKEASLTVIGSSKLTVKTALNRVGKNEQRIPVFEGQISNDISQNELESILSFVEENRPRYVLLALTTEKQLDLIAKIIQSSNAFPAIYIGIGGSFDMISGIYIRAPKLIQKIGLEWIWRAFQNPKNLFPRYAKDFSFLLGFFVITKLTNGDRGWRNFQNY